MEPCGTYQVVGIPCCVNIDCNNILGGSTVISRQLRIQIIRCTRGNNEN